MTCCDDQMVANLLERQAIGDQARRAGVSQRVRALVGCLDLESGKSSVDDMVDG